MKRNVRHICFIFVSAAMMLAGCVSSSIVWTGNHSFSSLRWQPEELVVFTPDTMSVGDSTVTATRGVLSIRYSAGAEVETLPLVMEIESPGTGLYRCDTIREQLLPMAERTAHKGKMGIFETIDTVPLHSAVTPGWTVSFYPASEEDIDGIISLTLDIIK